MKLRLRELRIEQGLTQEQVCKYIFVNQSMYCRYESGKLSLSLRSAEKLARLYNVSMDYLMGLSDDKICGKEDNND